MRVLLVTYGVYPETASGAARGVRTMMSWLTAAGHQCQVLSAATFASASNAELRRHLAGLGIPIRRACLPGRRAVLDYDLSGVAVRALENRHRGPTADPAEMAQFRYLLADRLKHFRPDLVVTDGSDVVLQLARQQARAANVTTMHILRARGCEDRKWFAHTDRVLCASPSLANHYLTRIGLHSTPLPPPITWSDVQGTAEGRGFLTLVSPSPDASSDPSPARRPALVATLAERFGQDRPDIPILIVQADAAASDAPSWAASWAASRTALARYPQIVVSRFPVVPRELFSLTKILLAPALCDEPSSRMATEAMINGIPVGVGDRGALMECSASAGLILRLPARSAGHPPSEETEVQAWFRAVTHLWYDDPAYRRAADAARQTAHTEFPEDNVRARYQAFFTAPGPYPPLF